MANSQQGTMPPAPPPYYMQQRKTRWWIPVVTIAAVFAAIIIVFIIGIAVLSTAFDKEPYQVKKNSVLYLNLKGNLEERTNDSPFNFLNLQNNFTHSDVLWAIKRAKADDRIKGIFIKGGLAAMGFAKAEEIRKEIEDFKKSGKFVYAYLDWGRELDYYLALTADKIYMPREGMLELNGFAITAMFYKGLFDKIGIDYFVLGFEDFKSAGEAYSRKNFSDSARYQYRIILNQRLNHLIDAIVDSKGLDRQFVSDALDRGIYSADSLFALGFIDSLLFEEDVKMMIKKEIFPDLDKEKDSKKDSKKKSKEKYSLVSIGNYIQDLPEIKDKNLIAERDKQIAIIYASGPLVEQVQEDFSDELKITSKEFISSLKKAREDDNVKVIIIRIDSPGGSVITSDAIYEEIKKTTEVKPVYASMSDVAASGGYYIAAPCDTIIAHPSTITGSIGVVMAIPNLSKLMDNLYLSVDTIATGPAATQLSGLIPLNEKEKAKVKNIARGVYDRFLNKVAKHRNKTYDEVRAIAKGRVWTGEDAYKIGIVDVLGGFDKAISLAKQRMGVPDSMKVHIQEYPRKKDAMETILKMFDLGDQNDDEVKIDITEAMAKYLGVGVEDFIPAYNALPEDVKDQIKYMITIIQLSEKEKVLMTLPEKVIIE
ncbi:signal peptide peptidase SppA [Bacteroidota bacterium]